MTKFLTELVTDKTPVLSLKNNSLISQQKKQSVLDLNIYSDSSLAKKYIRYMYYYRHVWYYFKKDEENFGYPFYIIDELMGSYLAKKIELPAVSYQVAKVNDEYGIASANFKNSKYDYYTFYSLKDRDILGDGIYNISYLSDLCFREGNEQLFLKHLFQLFALDIYMLQKDRCNVNLQFQKNKRTSEFDIAPIYDFSNCIPSIGMSGIGILKNVVFDLNELSIPKLVRLYPEFKEQLSYWLDQSMKEMWDQICSDYHFNQDCSSYERIKDYYETKEESTKKYIKQLINDVQKMKSVV